MVSSFTFQGTVVSDFVLMFLDQDSFVADDFVELS